VQPIYIMQQQPVKHYHGMTEGIMYTCTTDLILLQRPTNKQTRLLQHSLTAAMSNVVVRLVWRFVLVIFHTSSFPIIAQPQQSLTAYQA